MGRSHVRVSERRRRYLLNAGRIFTIKERSFKKLIGLILKQGQFVIDMSDSLAVIVEQIRDGTLHQGSFVVEEVGEEKILDYPKGSHSLVEMLRPRQVSA